MYNPNKMKERIGRDVREFKALDELLKWYGAMNDQRTDSRNYPVYRGHYEAALIAFIGVLRENGRV